MKIQPTPSAYESGDKLTPEGESDDVVAFGPELLALVLPVPVVKLPELRQPSGGGAEAIRVSSAVEADVRSQVESTHTQSRNHHQAEQAHTSAPNGSAEQNVQAIEPEQEMKLPEQKLAQDDETRLPPNPETTTRLTPITAAIVQAVHREVAPVTHADIVHETPRSTGAAPVPAPAELSNVRVNETATGTRAAVVELNHPELGRVELEIQRSKDGLEITAKAASLTAAVALRASENVLRASVASHGIRLKKLRVAVADENEDAQRTDNTKNKSRTRRKRPLDMEA